MKSWLIVLAASVLLFGEAAAQVPGTRSSEVVSMAGTDYYLHRVAPGETVYSLSRLYGVAEERFYEDNPAVKEAGLKAGETVVSDIYYSESVGGCYCFAAGVPVFPAARCSGRS